MQRIAALSIIALLLACGADQLSITGGCGTAALCALQPTLVVMGDVRVNAAPLAGALVRVDAHQGTCAGTPVPLLPSPAEAITNADGVYSMRLQPTVSAAAACLRVSSPSAAPIDTTGIVLRVPPATPETVRVNLVGP